MTAFALLLVLGAAVLHAVWNLAAKRAGSGLPFVFAVGIVMTTAYVPILVAIAWPSGGLGLAPADFGIIAVSTVLKTTYALLLQRAYRSGDFSLVYPLIRGSAPLLATLGAGLFLGEFPTPQALIGAGLIASSIFFLCHGERLWQRTPGAGADTAPRKLVLFNALLTGSLIACYTVWDRHAVGYRHITPVVFDGLTNIGTTLLLAPLAWRCRPEIATLWRTRRREIFTVACLSPLAYVLVLTALRFTPVSYVAPAREFSILIGAFLGARLLRERETPRRLGCAFGMVVGLITLATA